MACRIYYDLGRLRVVALLMFCVRDDEIFKFSKCHNKSVNIKQELHKFII